MNLLDAFCFAKHIQFSVTLKLIETAPIHTVHLFHFHCSDIVAAYKGTHI